ncbi:DUF2029 domain-containing protein [Sphingomonas sp.]
MRPATLLLIAATMLALLAWARPVDHDESQYVAAAILARNGWPYRDFAYLQTPLQPLLLAPLAALAGAWAWPALRLFNALCGLIAIAAIYRAARTAGVGQRSALVAAAGFGVCDALLFSAAMARNDALPVAMLAVAVALAMARQTPARAAAIGLLLASAAAVKISFALPAAAYGLYALASRDRCPFWIAAGAIAPTLLVAWCWALAPQGFWFGVFDFPARAPADYYLADGRAWKLSLGAKAVDALKFLALGPALLALVLVWRDRGRGGTRLLDILLLAGLVAALLPTPTWRQYLLPLLPPLFVRLAMAIDALPPSRNWRIAGMVFAAAGLAPSIEALSSPRPGMTGALRESRAVADALDAAAVRGPVASLSPQFLAVSGRAPDRRFAAGPFVWRTSAMPAPRQETELRVVTPRTIDAQFGPRGIWGPAAVLVGGEARWTAGNPTLDVPLEAWAIRQGWRRLPVAGTRFRLYAPQAARAARASISD